MPPSHRHKTARWAIAGAALTLIAGLLTVTPTANAAGALLSQGKPATASSTENAG
jgi:beta-glucosidase